jgi:hypothetical protein
MWNFWRALRNEDITVWFGVSARDQTVCHLAELGLKIFGWQWCAWWRFLGKIVAVFELRHSKQSLQRTVEITAIAQVLETGEVWPE